MFDMGFAELILIGIVGLLVIGPERLPGAIRTVSLWLNRVKRGFNDIKREVEQELHNDAVMQELRSAGEQLREDTERLSQEVQGAAETLNRSVELEAESTDGIADKADTVSKNQEKPTDGNTP